MAFRFSRFKKVANTFMNRTYGHVNNILSSANDDPSYIQANENRRNVGYNQAVCIIQFSKLFDQFESSF